MARQRDSGTDPKEAALAATRCLNPRPEQVADPEFLRRAPSSTPAEPVQVKYEMVRQAGPAAPRPPRPRRPSASPGQRYTPPAPRWIRPG